ncbi:chorismate mutase [Sphingomonas daechungensis]|uniref:chorismate mutase n=1 Tax=Sphingomonas daechungensis TaxID=1176646 RepID=A0ABX6T3F7_9SPHN|nr:chorismate mutase [Sphingomonas daechungensis]
MTQEQLQDLAALRGNLDRIDDQILDLIEQRLAASADIAARKDAEGDRHLKIRPKRQVQILDRLKDRSDRAAPMLIEQVWREIMAHSLQAQAMTDLVLARPTIRNCWRRAFAPISARRHRFAGRRARHTPFVRRSQAKRSPSSRNPSRRPRASSGSLTYSSRKMAEMSLLRWVAYPPRMSRFRQNRRRRPKLINRNPIGRPGPGDRVRPSS